VKRLEYHIENLKQRLVRTDEAMAEAVKIRAEIEKIKAEMGE